VNCSRIPAVDEEISGGGLADRLIERLGEDGPLVGLQGLVLREDFDHHLLKQLVFAITSSGPYWVIRARSPPCSWGTVLLWVASARGCLGESACASCSRNTGSVSIRIGIRSLFAERMLSRTRTSQRSRMRRDPAASRCGRIR